MGYFQEEPQEVRENLFTNGAEPGPPVWLSKADVEENSGDEESSAPSDMDNENNDEDIIRCAGCWEPLALMCNCSLRSLQMCSLCIDAFGIDEDDDDDSYSGGDMSVMNSQIEEVPSGGNDNHGDARMLQQIMVEV